jgi:hypothetical protein
MAEIGPLSIADINAMRRAALGRGFGSGGLGSSKPSPKQSLNVGVGVGGAVIAASAAPTGPAIESTRIRINEVASAGRVPR